MIRGVIICFPSAGLPSRFNLRTSESLDFFARAVPVIKLPTPMAEAIAARLPISFLRPNIFEVIGQKKFLRMLSRIVFDAGRVVRLSFDKFLWFPEERAAIFEHFEIEKMGQLAVRRSIPVGRSGETWTNSRAFGGWLNAGADG